VLLALLLAPALLLSSPRAEADPVDVALDPGHSYADIGASGGGLREYVLTLDLAHRIRTRLEEQGLSVRLTRSDSGPLSPMAEPDVTERTRIEQTARIEAAAPARIYVSLHFNGGPAGLRGTETYVNPDRAADTHLDFALAESIQRHVIAALAEQAGYAPVDRGVRNDLLAGKPYGHFFSLRGPSPSALLEALFLSNGTESALLKDGATLDAIADGCAQGILEYLASVGSVALTTD
jgi:N-acetylmuramoyl-L-alanine amidase